MFSTLVLATHNAGKVSEIRTLLQPYGVDVKSAGDMGLPEPEEDGDSFIANAEIKSRAATTASGLPALSDDSGLVIPALSGAPGIYSARWAGPEKDFRSAMQRVESELKSVAAKPPVHAYFVCVLSLCLPDGTATNFEGRVDGTLTFPPRGTQGFGYDPIFVPNGYHQTFGEMDAKNKHAISHRSAAFDKLVRYFTLNTEKVVHG